jgi:hypothetical protein
VPPRDIEDIIGSLKATQNFTCKKEGQLDLDMYVCNCDKNQFYSLKPLQLNVGGKLFTLPKEAWMSYDEERKENQKCKILMHPYDISMTATYKWVIGI